MVFNAEAEINNEDKHSHHSEDSFNITSPAFSEDNSEIWGCTTCNKNFLNMVILHFTIFSPFLLESYTSFYLLE